MGKSKVIGLDVLGDDLRRVLNSVDGDGQIAALLKGGAIIEEDARRRAPVWTGRLRDSMETRTLDKSQDGARVGVGPGPVDRPINQRDAFYQHIIEFGGKRRQAYPFLRPAADENRQAVIDTVREELRRRVEKAAR